jgi:nicotinamidase-related amidase
MKIEDLVNDALPFLLWIGDWKEKLPVVDLATVLSPVLSARYARDALQSLPKDLSKGAEVDDPASVAVLSVDVVNGFCYEGPLSSPRVAATVPPIVRLFERAHALGVRHFILIQDTHDDEAVEFGSFAPHCTRGSQESDTVPEFRALPFFDQFTVIPKNSISSSIGTELPAWLDARPEVTTFIVVGDCTDLCTYQLAMYLRLRANARQRATDRVVLPVDCVDTYDLPVAVAQELGIFPHHGDLVHLIFLYSMALNGVQVVASLV